MVRLTLRSEEHKLHRLNQPHQTTLPPKHPIHPSTPTTQINPTLLDISPQSHIQPSQMYITLVNKTLHSGCV